MTTSEALVRDCLRVGPADSMRIGGTSPGPMRKQRKEPWQSLLCNVCRWAWSQYPLQGCICLQASSAACGNGRKSDCEHLYAVFCADWPHFYIKYVDGPSRLRAFPFRQLLPHDIWPLHVLRWQIPAISNTCGMRLSNPPDARKACRYCASMDLARGC